MTSADSGQIVTFYSYKGGTGRTMALANIACLLSERKHQSASFQPLKVLAIDWDLEAPGLHRYFRPYLKEDGVQIFTDTPGCLEFFEAIEEQRSAFSTTDFEYNRSKIHDVIGELDLSRFLYPTEIAGLQLMKAGRFDNDYGRRVGQFRWDRLFTEVPGLFAGFAGYLRKSFDFILVDSRTGISDTGGICSMVLPDKLVVVFTPNQQSLTGIGDLVDKAVTYRKASPDARPLIVFPLPSRIEMNRPALLDFWRMGGGANEIHLPSGFVGYQPLFERLFAKIYGLQNIDLGGYFNVVMLQHIPDYAYGEPIAVMLEKSDSRLSLRSSYSAFLEHLLELRAPWESLTLVGLEREIDERINEAKGIIVKGDFDHALRIAWELMEKDPPTVLFEVLSLAILEIVKAVYPRKRSSVSNLIGQAIEQAIHTPDLDQVVVAEILAKVGELCLAEGDSRLAVTAFKQARQRMLQLFGEDSPEVMALGNNLVKALLDSGALNEARRLADKLFSKFSGVFSEEYPDTLESMNNLALIIGEQGDYSSARALQEKVLELRSRVLGEEYPDTLESMNNLALIIGAQGDYSSARALLEKVLELRRRVLGDEHPDTLESMNNLALIFDKQGDYKAARALQEKVLELRRRVLGDEHPDTLESMNNLALIFDKQGDYEAARTLQEKVLEMMRRVFGEEHPNTLGSMNNLALSLSEQGEYEAARTLQEKVLEMMRRVLGDEHPNTLVSMNNLAFILSEQGDFAVALPLQEKVLEMMRRVLGEEHPNTLASMNYLALILSEQGDYSSARALQEKVLELRRRVLGEEHPDTLESMNNLALTYSEQGDYNSARSLEEEVLEVRSRVLGDEHPDTLESINALAKTLKKLKDFSAAVTLQEKVFEVKRRTLGGKHRQTLNAMITLMNTAKDAGDMDRVLAISEELAKNVEQTKS